MRFIVGTITVGIMTLSGLYQSGLVHSGNRHGAHNTTYRLSFGFLADVDFLYNTCDISSHLKPIRLSLIGFLNKELTS